jgi:hypothetical protein
MILYQLDGRGMGNIFVNAPDKIKYRLRLTYLTVHNNNNIDFIEHKYSINIA